MLALLVAFAVSVPSKTGPVTMSGLLDEMVSTDSPARWPEHPFKLIQASSYDRKRTGPDKPDWFANADSSNYIRRESHNGREELVMMDADGPGAIVRFFATNAGGLKNPLRVYLDGSDQPVLESSFSDLTKLLPEVGPPLNAPHPPLWATEVRLFICRFLLRGTVRLRFKKETPAIPGRVTITSTIAPLRRELRSRRLLGRGWPGPGRRSVG